MPLGQRGRPKGRDPLRFLAPYLKMVWGHNLQHMAPFEPFTGGFCMVFHSPTLIFLTPNPIFGAPTPDPGPGRPGALFGPKKRARKTTLWRDWFPMRFPRIFCKGNGLYGTQEPFGCTNFPPIPPRGRFYKDFPQIQKSSGPPWAPGWVAYWPFVGHWPTQLPINPPSWACMLHLSK